MYSRLYAFHGLVMYLLVQLVPNIHKRIAAKNIMRKELINTFRSTVFLSGQTLLQRVILCSLSNVGGAVHPLKVYLASVIGSTPIFAERDFRVQQVNNLVLSHLLIGQMRKHDLVKTKLPYAVLAAAVVKDSMTIKTITFLVSIITSLRLFDYAAD